MDGVLVDVQASYIATVVETVRSLSGRPIDVSAIHDYKAAGGWNDDWALAQHLVGQLGVALSYEDVGREFQRIFLGTNGDGLIQRERWMPTDKTMDSLSASFGFAIFTGRPREEAEYTLQRNASAYSFDPIVAANDAAPKPAPDGLLLIRQRLEGWVVYVGDSVDDARSANAARVPFIGVRSAHSSSARVVDAFKELGAIDIIDDINDLPSALEAARASLPFR